VSFRENGTPIGLAVVDSKLASNLSFIINSILNSRMEYYLKNILENINLKVFQFAEKRHFEAKMFFI